MTPQANSVLSNALSLSENDRGEVAFKLIESLDPASDVDVEAAWGIEIEERLAQIRSGQVRSVPWTVAREMILSNADDADED